MQTMLPSEPLFPLPHLVLLLNIPYLTQYLIGNIFNVWFLSDLKSLLLGINMSKCVKNWMMCLFSLSKKCIWITEHSMSPPYSRCPNFNCKPKPKKNPKHLAARVDFLILDILRPFLSEKLKGNIYWLCGESLRYHGNRFIRLDRAESILSWNPQSSKGGWGEGEGERCGFLYQMPQ